MPVPPQLIAAGIKFGASFIGSGKRKREQAAANKEFQQARNELKNDKFLNPLDNPYADYNTDKYDSLTNRYSNLRVDTQSAEFQAEQSNRGLANLADALRQGGGNAASATVLASQSAQTQQQIAAGIGKQYQQLQQVSAQGQTNIDKIQADAKARQQELVGAGNEYITSLAEEREYNEQEKLQFFYGEASKRKSAADGAVQRATQSQIAAGTSFLTQGINALPSGGGGGADFKAYNSAQNTRGTIQSVNAFGG